MNHQSYIPENAGKFSDPDRTAQGEPRARVALTAPETLWFNTGTLCNIECVNCYIGSSPKNDALVYISLGEVADYLDALKTRGWPVREIGFTGGEPFMNPDFPEMVDLAAARGYDVLILTNAMRPMLRDKVQSRLADVIARYPGRLTFRVSLDHPDPVLNDSIRGAGAHEAALTGLRWLCDHNARIHIAGRLLWGTSDIETRALYADLYKAHDLPIDAQNPAETVLFPEMDETVDVPEITTACWGILNKSPEAMMCASSRMVVKRKGADGPTIIACTLLPFAEGFDLGPTLEGAEQSVALNHPHCAKFCVLGGASCSA